MTKKVVVGAVLLLVGVGVVVGSIGDSTIRGRIDNRRQSRTISRLARAGLWLLWWKSKKQDQVEVQHQIGPDGFTTIDHRGSL